MFTFLRSSKTFIGILELVLKTATLNTFQVVLASIDSDKTQNNTHIHSVGRQYKRKGEIFREKAALKDYMALQRPHSFLKEEELQLSHTHCVTFYDVLKATFIWQGNTHFNMFVSPKITFRLIIIL